MNLTRLALFLVLGAITLTCNGEDNFKFSRRKCKDHPSSSELVVGGEISPRDKWPWLVALSLTHTKMFTGGGSLLSERFVITAAHVLQNKHEKQPKKPKDLIGYLGKWNLSDPTEENVATVTLQEFFIHRDWNAFDQSFDADIALIKLVDDVKFTSKIQPVCLWTSEMKISAKNDGGIMVGW
jgi:secreted trypsin-like serine protease